MTPRAATALVGLLSAASAIILVVLVMSSPFPALLENWPTLPIAEVTLLFAGVTFGTLSVAGALVLFTRWETPSMFRPGPRRWSAAERVVLGAALLGGAAAEILVVAPAMTALLS